jgi:dihydroorotase
VITHCFTPLSPSIVDERGLLRPPVRAAQERGVVLDVGHAGRHTSFEIVRACLAQGLAPNIISSDLHAFSGSGPVVDLPTTLTKFLALGMSLEQVIAACTVNAARAIGWEDRIGRLAVGQVADIAVLELTNTPATLYDSVGAELQVDQQLKARATIRQGEVVSPSGT